MRGLFLVLAIASMLHAMAIGTVQKVEGIVKVKHKGSIKKSKVDVGYAIQEGDILSTFGKGQALLKLIDGSSVVLGKKSVISFDAPLKWSQKEGKVYYKITKKGTKKALKIKTDFAIIGIKGTTFIVSAEDSKGYVALKEGLIGIASIKEAFRLYKKKVLSEYENYVKTQQREFEKFKQAGEEYVVTTTKEFDLHAGNVVSFSEDKAVERPLQKREEFAEFERLLDE